MRNFKNFSIWKDAITLVTCIYEVAKELPPDERFGIRSQISRAAVSVPSNIAEGCSRNSELEFKRFLEIAIGSSFELETQIIICGNLGYLKSDTVSKTTDAINQLQKQITSLITKIDKSVKEKKA